MKRFSRLSSAVDSLERGAATAARALSEDLMRPTSDREDLTEQATTLRLALDEARGLVNEMRYRITRIPGGQKLDEAGRLQSLETRLRQWESVSDAVRDCLIGYEWPLLPEEPARLDLHVSQGAMLSDVFTKAHRAINPAPQHPDSVERGMFADIPLDASKFMAAVHLAYRLRLAQKVQEPWRFLDVGCGGGVKVAMASEFFDKAAGIEFDPGYVENASRTFEAMGAHRCEVIHMDALDFEGYDSFDVIYFYRPILDADDLLALEERIVESSHDNAVLIAPYHSFGWRAQALGCVQLDGPVFMKNASRIDLDDLMTEARRMGPHVFGADEDPPQGLGWLRPLWLACAANGIRPS